MKPEELTKMSSKEMSGIRLGAVVSILSVMAIITSGCDGGSSSYNFTISQESPQQAQPVQQPVPEDQISDSPPVTQSANSPRYKAKIWPPLKKDQSNKIAENILAENYYIILDASGSMAKPVNGRSSEKRIDAAKSAVTKFIQQLPRDVNLGLLTFQPTRELVELGPDQHQEVVKYVKRLTPAGRTPLNRAMQIGYEALENQARRQTGYGNYKLIVVTDGRSTDDDPSNLARSIINESPVEVHVIGFAVQNHALNIPGVTEYVTANSSEELIEALTGVTKSEVEAFDANSFSL